MADEAQASESGPELGVCLVVDGAYLEYFPESLRYLLIGLVDAGVEVVAVGPGEQSADLAGSAPVEFIELRGASGPFRRWSRRGSMHRLARRMEQMGRSSPVLVHTLGGGACEWAAEAARTIECRWVASADPPGAVSVRRSLARTEGADRILVGSQFAVEAFVAAGCDAKRVALARPGIPITERPPRRVESEHVPSLVYAGPLESRCGLESLLRSFRVVLARHPTTVLFLIGRGSAEGLLRQETQGLGLSRQVVFAGRLRALRSALAAADILCVPRREAAVGEALPLAMACGLAIVAGREVGWDGLEDGRTALLTAEEDEEGLADAVCHLLEDAELGRRLGEQARLEARSLYAVGAMVEAHLSLYREATHEERTFPIGAR
jgi:glycosyltransferase involved in cell wall biosynthesis